MEYTEEQIEEAVRVWEADNDKSWVDLAKLIMRMMREEAKAAKLYARLCDQSHGALNPTPPEFWKEPKKPATESPWRPIGAVPINQVVLFGDELGERIVGYADNDGRLYHKDGVRICKKMTDWMPIPELPE